MWEIIFIKIWGGGVYELEIRLAGVELITPNLDALAEAIKKEQQNKARLLGVATIQGYKFYSK
ncbi:TPA: hypothetical protein ACKQDN_004108 [Serratia marcescens]